MQALSPLRLVPVARPCRGDLLLVDDAPSDIRAVRGLFEGHDDIRLQVTGSADAALRYLRGAPPYGHAPAASLVLLKLKLCHGSGLSVLEAVKSDPALRHIPVIAIALEGDELSVSAAYALHVNCCLTWPSCPDGLRALLDAACQFWLSVASLPR